MNSGRKILLIGILTITLLLSGLFLYLSSAGKQTNNRDIDSPTPTPVRAESRPNDGAPGQEAPSSQDSLEKKRQSGLVYELITKLPYSGTHFSLSYSYENDKFLLNIDPQFKQNGNNEFDSFLLENGILSRSWFENLFVSYITPTGSSNQKTSPDDITPGP